ncbi:Syntaxin-31 [Turnera subulata]|uniref:Syntaxin-31 n=1 Tax=Turnera subulata TaxID=218843 RepID=A0A9Q0FRZ0_9ROSI|nr:Syntaxin-31 [Turnera subulata]
MYDSGARTLLESYISICLFWMAQARRHAVQPFVQPFGNYSQSRAVALYNVESTITELSGFFTHLATMVAQQGELAIRIDDNMDESLSP